MINILISQVMPTIVAVYADYIFGCKKLVLNPFEPFNGFACSQGQN